MMVFVFVFLSSVFSILSASDITYITPGYMLFETVLATQQDGRLEGDGYNVILSIVSYDGDTVGEVMWSTYYSNHSFVSGVASFVLSEDDDGVALDPTVFEIENPHFALEIYEQDSGDFFISYIPMTAVPYAMQAARAEEALYVDAAVIEGEFLFRCFD